MLREPWATPFGGKHMLALVFLIVALVLFILAAIPVTEGGGRLVPAGLAFLTAALIATNSSLF